ncbi:hypothetical protein [Segniliparus rugosus]|uniref:Transmembrane protein n=1 Tax=Segniliparus rugosus (strain ATCC BAA-974 / DSM 45345 / CCUG 50838 / CIP 108380 / JCM 13579 / CDC 945) TaxID=679197 RepID=U1N5G3_SEGRC|nr:hypothetical protein [Segniliparus rugosus]ERG69384.1 hypothetical protein HMPREF9336_04080 [Segniliparus rugosus ATCC BAA-974]
MKNRKLLALAVALLVAQLAARGAVAWRGGFYWDDLVLAGRAGASSPWSGDSLLRHHDGHFMPAAFLLAGATTKLAPLRWLPAFLELLALQALASLAVLRLLRLILGWRPLVLVLFAWYLFTPLTLPSFAWWSAALNALPLHAGLAWAAGEMILLVRVRPKQRLRHAAGALLAFAAALSFFEKALLIPFFATAVAALSLRVTGHRSPLRTTLRRSRALWLGYALVIAAWAALYLSAPLPKAGLPQPGIVLDALWRTNAQGLVPSAFGGPLLWTRPQPIAALAHPPDLFAAAAAMCALLLVGASLRRVAHAGRIWLMFLGYAAACETMMLLWRINLAPDGRLGLSLRYIADCAVALVAALALIARSARRWRRKRLALPASAVVCCASLVSTASFAQAWSDNPTDDYLDTVRRELASDQSTPLLDQAVPYNVLSWNSYPDNLMSHVFAPVRERPPFASSTPVLRFVDDRGHFLPGQLVYVRAIPQGPVPGCGYRVEPGEAAELPLSGPLLDWEWTAQLNYYASTGGTVAVQLPSGRAQRVPVAAGLHTVFVRLDGGGARLLLRPLSPGLWLCVGAGPVGAVWPK